MQDETIDVKCACKIPVWYKVRKRTGMLSQTRKNITLHTTSTIYTSLLFSLLLTYCDITSNCCGSVNAGKSEKRQRRKQA